MSKETKQKEKEPLNKISFGIKKKDAKQQELYMGIKSGINNPVNEKAIIAQSVNKELTNSDYYLKSDMKVDVSIDDERLGLGFFPLKPYFKVIKKEGEIRDEEIPTLREILERGLANAKEEVKEAFSPHINKYERRASKVLKKENKALEKLKKMSLEDFVKKRITRQGVKKISHEYNTNIARIKNEEKLQKNIPKLKKDWKKTRDYVTKLSTNFTISAILGEKTDKEGNLQYGSGSKKLQDITKEQGITEKELQEYQNLLASAQIMFQMMQSGVGRGTSLSKEKIKRIEEIAEKLAKTAKKYFPEQSKEVETLMKTESENIFQAQYSNLVAIEHRNYKRGKQRAKEKMKKALEDFSARIGKMTEIQKKARKKQEEQNIKHYLEQVNNVVYNLEWLKNPGYEIASIGREAPKQMEITFDLGKRIIEKFSKKPEAEPKEEKEDKKEEEDYNIYT